MRPIFYIRSAGILLFILYIVVAEIWNNFTIITHMDLYALGGLSTTVRLALDWKRLNFILVVCIISMRVLIYSNWYINRELNTVRFILLVLIFVLRMLILISRSRFIRVE
jgi:NADH:ubiquinone oxidoreductase subunit 5 (subunit L)/multisubunit Na+/H+ antiporter MnhA subunit